VIRAAVAVAVAVAAAAGSATAGELIWPDGVAERRMLLAEEAVEFRGVGRLEVGGGRFCTATLISPTEVLTAAHCLFHPRSAKPVRVEALRFLAGRREGESAAERRVTATAIPASFELRATPAAVDLGDDVALLALDAPIGAEAATPFAVGPLYEGEAAPVIVSYARDRRQAPSINEACPPLGLVAGVMVLACAIEKGVSGAPVLAGEGAGVRVAGVVSAMGRLPGGEEFTLAPIAAPWLDVLRAQLGANGEDMR